MICTLALFAVGFLLPFYLEELREFSTIRAALLYTPLPMTLAVMAPLSGAMADRVGSRWLAPLGLAIGCAGLILMTRLTRDTTMSFLILCLIVTGIGQGLFQSPNARTIMLAAPMDLQGALATALVLGQSLSVAVAGAVFAGFGGEAAGSALVTGGATLGIKQVSAFRATLLKGLDVAFGVCAVLAAVGVITALARREQTSKSEDP